jgi:tetratricopeptide (TPR) repeat protein
MAARSYWLQGDYNESRTLAQEALALAQQNAHQRGIASSLNNLGIVAFDQRDYEAARDYYQQSLAIRQRIVDQQGIAACLNNLAIIANDQGDFAQAREYQQQSLAISQAIGSQLGIALSFASLGYTYVRLGEGPAQQAFYQALKILHAIQVVPLILVVMVGFAALRLRAGDPARAGELAGLLASHPARHPDLLKLLDELIPVLKTILSDDDLTAAMERGKTLDLDKVVRDLLVECA